MTERLDQRLVSLGLARSRAQAQALIKAGKVTLAGTIQKKPSHPCPADAQPAVEDSELTRYVSRGGLKLEGALRHCNLPVAELTLLDMGQSTGGFTDCLLQAGATKVVGVDVGIDQLVTTIRNDSRVVCFEGINGRELPENLLRQHAPDGFDGVVMDVSFISQTLIIPALVGLIRPGGFLLSLVKPQFELQPEQIGKGGIVRDDAHYQQVESKIRRCLKEHLLNVEDYFNSSIHGGDGNREFFVLARK